MRIATVFGKVTLNQAIPELVPGSLLLVRVADRGTLAGKNDGKDEMLVTYDCLAAREGDQVGISDGREATVPFLPEKVPYDCYCSCILDRVEFDPILESDS